MTERRIEFPLVCDRTIGTARTELEGQANAAHDVLIEAITALYRMAPNGRDYHLKRDKDGNPDPDAINRATEQHRAWIDKLGSVKADVMAYWMAIADQE